MVVIKIRFCSKCDRRTFILVLRWKNFLWFHHVNFSALLIALVNVIEDSEENDCGGFQFDIYHNVWKYQKMSHFSEKWTFQYMNFHAEKIDAYVNFWRENSKITKNETFWSWFQTPCECFFFSEMLRHLYFIVKNENSGACGMRETPPRGAVGKMLHGGGHS